MTDERKKQSCKKKNKKQDNGVDIMNYNTNEMVNPTIKETGNNQQNKKEMTNMEKETALRIEQQIKEKGFLGYLNPILDKVHDGTHENIYKALFGMYSVISGQASYFITPVSETKDECCSELDIALRMIPQEFVLCRDKETHSTFTKVAEQDSHYYDHKIYDMRGQNKPYDQKDLIKAMCRLISEGSYKYGVLGWKDGKRVPSERALFTESIGILSPTVTPKFLEDNPYLASRTLELSLD